MSLLKRLIVPFAAVAVIMTALPASAAESPSLRLFQRDDNVLLVAAKRFPRSARGVIVLRAGEYRRVKRVWSDGDGDLATTIRVPRRHRDSVRVSVHVARRTAATTLAMSSGHRPRSRRSRPTPVATPTVQAPTPTTTTAPGAPTATPPTRTTDNPRDTFGVEASFTPAFDSLVQVGELNQALLNDRPQGHRFALAPGVHRIDGPLVPREGQAFYGLPGAVISGARVLSDWVADNGRWYVTGQTQQLPRITDWAQPCYTGNTTCNLSEDVWVNDVLQQQVTSLADLRPGTYFFDYAADRIYVGSDPTGAKVETSVATTAFDGPAVPNVTLRNLVVEKFGNRGETGAIVAGAWQVVNNEIRHNHAQGLQVHGAATVRGNAIHHNGQYGIVGFGAQLLVERNEIAFNNTQGFDSWWAAGGTKFVNTTGLVVRGNWSHHNDGPGLWTDINNINTLYESNVVEHNTRPGIFHEISFDAVIRDNIARHNGNSPHANFGYLDNAQILVVNSRNVEVAGNTVTGRGGIATLQDNRTGGNGKGAWLLENLSVHHNTITHTAQADGQTGMVVYHDVPDGMSYFASRNNRFEANTYHVPKRDGVFWVWGDTTGDTRRTWNQWRGYGQEATGRVLSS